MPKKKPVKKYNVSKPTKFLKLVNDGTNGKPVRLKFFSKMRNH